jgi:multidrug efflux pump subunit AcrA (membrane-fusion protein)
VSEGEAVVEIVAMDEVYVWLDVPEQYLVNLSSSGAHVRVRFDAIGREVETTIAGIVADIDPLSRLAPVRIDLDNKDGAIKPGMSVVGLIPTGHQGEVLTIHKDAILRSDTGEYVYYDAGGRAETARIERLFAVGDRVAIKPGTVTPGMKLVVEGNERLGPGTPLVISGEGAAGGSG